MIDPSSQANPLPPAGRRETQPVREDGGLGGKATWSASPDQIPELQKYIASVIPGPKPRKVWPWIVAVLAIFILLGAFC